MVRYISHHGIKGQKWGVKNGPPYPLDISDHSYREKKMKWEESLDKKNEASKKKSKMHYSDSPKFKIIKKKDIKPIKKYGELLTRKVSGINWNDEKVKKIVTIGVVAVAAYAGYKYLKNSNFTKTTDENLYNRIKDSLVKNPNSLFDKDLWNESLTMDEQNAVQSYTGSSYASINKALRDIDNAKLDHVLLDKINDITSAIDKSELEKEVTTFRAVSFDAANDKMFPNISLLDGKDAKEKLIGKFFQEDAFFSSSPKYQSQFEGLEKGVKLTTICPPGTKALYIGKKSNYPYEKELLLQRGTQFEILDVIYDINDRVEEIVMQAVGNDQIDLSKFQKQVEEHWWDKW